MSRATAELDFFGLKKANASKSQFQKFLHRRRSFRDIQGSISKIDPEVLKTVIGSGNQSLKRSCSSESSANENQVSSGSVPSSPRGDRSVLHALPVYSPAPWTAASVISSHKAPLTIFYNGVVTVYDVPRDKAESILKMAVEGSGATAESADPKFPSPSSDRKHLLESLNSIDLPIFRKKSLQRFLEKRKERLMASSPYGCSN